MGLRVSGDSTEAGAQPVARLLGWSAAHSSDQMLAAARQLSFTGVESTHSGGRNMIETSAAGVTKARALAALAAASATTASNDDDGVARILERLFA